MRLQSVTNGVQRRIHRQHAEEPAAVLVVVTPQIDDFVTAFAVVREDERGSEIQRYWAQKDEQEVEEIPLDLGAKSKDRPPPLDEADEDPMIGRRLGAYRIEREIGRGGMGAVYEAMRADGELDRKSVV